MRARPLLGKELVENPNVCIDCREENESIIIGKDRQFQFDKVFDSETD